MHLKISIPCAALNHCCGQPLRGFEQTSLVITPSRAQSNSVECLLVAIMVSPPVSFRQRRPQASAYRIWLPGARCQRRLADIGIASISDTLNVTLIQRIIEMEMQPSAKSNAGTRADTVMARLVSGTVRLRCRPVSARPSTTGPAG